MISSVDTRVSVLYQHTMCGRRRRTSIDALDRSSRRDSARSTVTLQLVCAAETCQLATTLDVNDTAFC